MRISSGSAKWAVMAWVSTAEAQRAQPDVERRLPHRLVPLHRGGAPDVVDEDVEGALLGVDALDERRHLLRLEVVDLHGDALPAGLVDELGRLLDRLRPVHLRSLRPASCARCSRRWRRPHRAATAIPRPAARVAPATSATRPVSGCSTARASRSRLVSSSGGARLIGDAPSRSAAT